VSSRSIRICCFCSCTFKTDITYLSQFCGKFHSLLSN
jgi:hypothetical protein